MPVGLLRRSISNRHVSFLFAWNVSVEVCLVALQPSHAMHQGAQRFVKHISTLIGSYAHLTTPGSDGLIDVYHLNDLVKDRKVIHTNDQNCRYCLFRAKKDPKARSQVGPNYRRLLSSPRTIHLRSICQHCNKVGPVFILQISIKGQKGTAKGQKLPISIYSSSK